MWSPVTSPLIIEGVTVYNPLPSQAFVDLDNECIVPIGGDIDSLDEDDLLQDLSNIVNSGKLPNGVHWGITSRFETGFADILVDSSEVTEETVRQLIAAKVVTASCPN